MWGEEENSGLSSFVATARSALSLKVCYCLVDLQGQIDLDHLFIVYAGPHRFPLTDRISAIGAVDLLASQDPFSKS